MRLKRGRNVPSTALKTSYLAPIVLVLPLLLSSCKGKESAAGEATPAASGAAKSTGATTETSAPKGPLVTKPYDQLAVGDLAAVVKGLGWTPGQTSNASSGSSGNIISNIQQTAKKDGETKQLVVAVYKMPAANLAQWKTYNTDYAMDVQGSTVFGVKTIPADAELAKKLLSQALGK